MAVSWSRRVAAWTAFLLFVVAVAVVIRWITKNAVELPILVLGLGLVAAASWWFITEVGILRLVAVAVGLLGAGLIVLAVEISISTAERVVIWSTALVVAMTVPAVLARFALVRPVRPAIRVGESPRRPTHPVLLCNPWSGGGKVERFRLVELADQLGVETVMLERGLDLEQLTRDAVARGADCLGMAGGDGSQALVASVALEHDLHYVCIPAGTRNHLALDLGLDREDPRGAMKAFGDGVERRIDIGTVNGRVFVNNVSLGIYATIVQSPEYRDAKVEVSRSMIHELLGRQSEPFDLEFTTPEGEEISGAFVVMVANNPYTLGARRDASQRRQMDSGELGVFAVATQSATQAARLITLATMGMRDISDSWHEFTTGEFEVRSKSGTAFAGIDGEALEMNTPMTFRIHPRALRLFVPEGNLELVERRRARNLSIRDLAMVAIGREPRTEIVQ